MQNIFNSVSPRANILMWFTVQPFRRYYECRMSVIHSVVLVLSTMVEEVNQKKQTADDHNEKNIDLK